MALVENISNTTLSDSSAGDDLVVVSIWATILIYALVTNTLTVIGISRSRSMRGASSYWIVISLAICDLFMIVISLIHIIPATYLHEDFVEIRHMRTIWAMFAYNVFWYTGVVQLAAMAVNRFVSIVFPLQYKRVFSPRNTLAIIVLLYLVGLLSSLPSLHDCCYIVYDYNMYVTYYWPEDSNYMWLDILLNTLSVLTMILCYAAILVRVRRSTLTRRKHQMVALAARARRSSGAALLPTTASTAPSTMDSGMGSAAATSNSPVKTHLVIPNGNVSKGPHGHRLSTVALPASSSLSALNNNNENNNDKVDTVEETVQKQALARTASASPVMARARFFVTNEPRGQEPEQDGGASQKLLSPQPQPLPRLRLTGLSLSKKHPHHHHHYQQQQQASRREIRLFVQFFVVSLVFLSTWVTWQWLPRIPNASKWIYFATTTFFFINNAVNPTVYLIFNSGLRHQVKMLFYPGHNKCDAAKAAAVAAAVMGGNQAITRYNSSSSGSNPNNQAKGGRHHGKAKTVPDDYSVADEGSDELQSSSNMALAASVKENSSVTTYREDGEQHTWKL